MLLQLVGAALLLVAVLTHAAEEFTENFNLLFSAGHSIAQQRYTVWYLGLYWTGGPKTPDKK